jgi:CBS domain containing-hemolysin-like protein
MGSSPFTLILLAAVFCLLYLVFDAMRSLVVRLGPVRLRSLIGDLDTPPRRHRFDPYDAGTVAVVLLQISLAFGVAMTAAALWNRGPVEAAVLAAGGWALLIVLWKMLIESLPERAGDVIFRSLLPVTSLFFYLAWPIIYPLLAIIDRSEIRSDEDGEEEEVSEEEVQAYIDVGEEEGILEEGEGKLLQSLVDFGDTLAHEVMTPRIDMLAFDVDQPFDALAALFSESKYSRIPVYQGSIDRIVGVVHVKDVFDAHLRDEHPEVLAIARPVYFVTGTKKLSELLRELQVEHQQIAIVVDEYGGTAGLLTIEDVVEEIFGEISDEHEDSEESLLEVDDDVYLVNGALRIERLEEELDVELSGEHYETVAGLIFTTLGHIPKIGERISRSGVAFEVKSADRKRIYRVQVTREEIPAEPRSLRARAE